jgi:arylsulfatase A-like enzyme
MLLPGLKKDREKKMKPTNLSSLLLSSMGAAVAFQAQAAKPVAEKNQQKPNILFILADDMGYGDLGCYGNRVIRTPVIDSLSAQSMRFTDCYAGASVSSPSRCCLMTGMNTGHSRIRGNTCKVGGLQGEREGISGLVRRTNLQPEDLTMAKVLHDQGYRTCLVNKWHLDGFDTAAGPLDRGFDEFYGWLINEPRSHNFYPSVRWRNRERYIIEPNLNGQHLDHNTDRSTDEAIDFIRRMAKGCTYEACEKATVKAVGLQKQPFFLYLAYNVPHVPLDAKDRTLYEKSGLPLNDQSYASLISHMDESIGRVLHTLEELGLDKNTLVVFASDNGGATAAELQTLKPNASLRGWKGELYEGGIRVPMMVRWPGHVRSGSESSQPCYFPDFFPTFAHLAGAKNLKTDGVDLYPVLTEKKIKLKDRFLYWEQFPKKGLSQAVRYENWKAVRMNLDKPWELYNLKEDPSESRNVAAEYPEIVAKIDQYATGARTESECWPVD